MDIKKLKSEITKHDKLYWEQNSPEISDEEYDLLKLQLKSINPTDEFFDDVDTQKSLHPQRKYRHKIPMLSLEKFTSKEKVIKWMKGISRTSDEKFRFELKLDGISGKIEDGHLATRGDGKLGEDHTPKLPYLSYFTNETIDPFNPSDCIGEIIITDKFFKNNLKNEFKNSRNATSGLMGRKHAKEVEGKGLVFVDYDWSKITKTTNLDEIDKNWDKWIDEFTNLGLPYDGIVIKLADKDYYKDLGNKTNCPKGAIAYKFANKRTITEVRYIRPQVSRNGNLIPVAELEPVELAGVTISKATCHNYDFIKNKEISSDSHVILERAGDVIPKITEIIKKGKEVHLPKNCPCCKTITISKGVHIVCPNKKCEEQIIQNMLFIGKILNIEEMGRPTVEKIYRYKYFEFTDVTSFNDLTYHDILSFDGFAESSAKTLYRNIQNALINITETQFLASFGIEGCGRRVIDKLLTKAKNIENLLNFSISKLTEVEGVGIILATNFINSIKEYDIERVHRKYCNGISTPKQEHYNVTKEVKETICFTGKGEYTRNEYNKMAKNKGYIPSNSIDKKLNILVTNNITSQSSKMKKANKYGIKIITYEEFYKL